MPAGTGAGIWLLPVQVLISRLELLEACGLILENLRSKRVNSFRESWLLMCKRQEWYETLFKARTAQFNEPSSQNNNNGLKPTANLARLSTSCGVWHKPVLHVHVSLEIAKRQCHYMPTKRRLMMREKCVLCQRQHKACCFNLLGLKQHYCNFPGRQNNAIVRGSELTKVPFCCHACHAMICRLICCHHCTVRFWEWLDARNQRVTRTECLIP